MTNRTICITGASSGIGAELAKQYAKEGVHLLLIGRNEQRLAEVARCCKAHGATVVLGVIDVTQGDKLVQWCRYHDEKTPVDLVIANAGISGNQSQKAAALLLEQEALLVDIHLKGTLNTVHAFLPGMLSRGRGHIAVMSSMAAYICLPSSYLYGALKRALLYYGLALRQRYASRHVDVSVICPGFVDSALTRLNKHAMPLLMPVDKACRKIISGLSKNKPTIIFPWRMYVLCRFYGLLPWRLRIKISRWLG